MYYLNPEPGQLEAFLANFPTDKPVVMLNLLHFADEANYAAEAEAEPCTGLEAYMRYGALVAEQVAAVGGEIVWQGAQRTMVIGPEDKDWQMVVLVQYPRPQAFVDMVTSEAYQAIAFHRTAALTDSRLIALEQW